MRKKRERREARELAEGWAIPAPIVECESGFANEAPNSSGAAGYYQINDWNGKAQELGLAHLIGRPYANEHSKQEQGILARTLYRQQGTGPWVESEGCWGGRV